MIHTDAEDELADLLERQHRVGRGRGDRGVGHRALGGAARVLDHRHAAALLDDGEAGGARAFSEYYLAKYDGAQFQRSLVENVVFAQHNLVSDRSFNEFNVIVCRNVMIYFDRALQERVHNLFYESLMTFGVLALGAKESIRFSPHEEAYEELDANERVYRKVE